MCSCKQQLLKPHNKAKTPFKNHFTNNVLKPSYSNIKLTTTFNNLNHHNNKMCSNNNHYANRVSV